MAWLSKLVNVVWWPATAAKHTVAYISRPFISGVLLLTRGFVAVVQGSGDSAQTQEVPQTEAIIPESSASSDNVSEQLGTWAWVPGPVCRVIHIFVIKPIKFVQGRVREARDYASVWIVAYLPPLSLHHALAGLYCLVAGGLGFNILFMNIRDCSIVRRLMRCSEPVEPSPQSPSIVSVEPVVEEFMRDHYPGYKYEILCELGSRMKKGWVLLVTESGTAEHEEDRWLLTYAPVSQNCPLVLHEHQRGLNKLLIAVKEHPCIHPIKEVYYSATHEKLIIVQPYRPEGSLKDLIYKVDSPTLDWSQKYARRSKGLSPENVAQYGRHVLEGMLFLYDLGFPPIDHVQSGNVFVVDDVCLLGGYENTLLGYKTRIYRLCKDHLSHLDVVLFGHLIFEMAAGYELTEVRPGVEDYKAVPSAVRPILEFIFADGFPHSIQDIAKQDFFKEVSYLPELRKFDSSTVHAQLSDSAKTVLEKVHKNKPRIQKPPSAIEVGIKALLSRIHVRMPRFSRVKKDHKSADQASISSKQSFS